MKEGNKKRCAWVAEVSSRPSEWRATNHSLVPSLYNTSSSSFPVRLIPDKHSPRLDPLTENPSDIHPSLLVFFSFIRITPSHAAARSNQQSSTLCKIGRAHV